MTKSKKGSSRAKKNNMGGRKIKGRGNYATFNLRGMAQKLDQALSSIPKGAFARKGAQMGAKYGPLGALAGKGLGAGLAAVTGYGNYSVRANSLSKVSTSVDMIPQFVKNDHSIRVTHREFIKDLVVPTNPSDFNLQSFLINPANSVLFPWLATMARQYSQYKIHGMVFAYKTMSSDITAGGSLGTVVMATNYNSIDRAFITKIEMENSEFAVSTKPSMSLVHAIECDPKYSGLDVLYVRDPFYETTDTNDRRFYDYGRFQVATTGLPGLAGTTMGELWVSYDIEFMKPVLGGGGVPGFVSGVTVLSKADGTFAVGNTTQKEQVVRLDGAAINPSASTVTRVLPASYTAVGDTGIVDNVVSVTSTDIVLRRNGKYLISILGNATTTATALNLPVFNIPAVIGFPRINSGSALGSVSIIGTNVLPGAGYQAVSTTGYSYALNVSVTVTGISLATDYVTITPDSFTTNAANLVTSFARTVRVEWLLTGVNDQSPVYV